MTTEWTDLGAAADVGSVPRRMEAGGAGYLLVRVGDGEYRVYSEICPHMGGRVEAHPEGFACASHGWRFDGRTGACINVPGQHLRSYPVRVEGARLLARLPAPEPQRTRGASEGSLRGADLSIDLVSHACLRIRAAGVELLTDPWLVGSAFLGAWVPYPHVPVAPETLQPDALWISHEHSDHFHIPTLERMDRSLPVYVPDFPNRRLPQALEALGFQQVHAMPFGVSVTLNDRMSLTCYEPGGIWNDAILLIETDDVRILNLNDAGLNARIARRVAPVDIVTSAFTPGASGYPITWDHLGDTEKSEIMQQSCTGMLDMLERAVDLYGATHLLPFAGHFVLQRPEHRSYMGLWRKNTVDDVVERFSGSETTVLDLLPGEGWQARDGSFRRIWKARDRLYEGVRVAKYTERTFAAEKPWEEPPLTAEEIEEYFLALNDVPELEFCEDVRVRLVLTREGNPPRKRWLEIRDGVLSLPDEPTVPHELTLSLPEKIAARILRRGLSWDEAHIGYWCRLHREPDVYHAGFWRLLQSPYRLRRVEAQQAGEDFAPGSALEEILERGGDAAVRILHRQGLYCLGCARMKSENLLQAAQQHGLDTEDLARLVQELNRTRGGEAALPV
jgi:CMP-N-acetylneuraminate monooxygenase